MFPIQQDPDWSSHGGCGWKLTKNQNSQLASSFLCWQCSSGVWNILALFMTMKVLSPKHKNITATNQRNHSLLLRWKGWKFCANVFLFWFKKLFIKTFRTSFELQSDSNVRTFKNSNVKEKEGREKPNRETKTNKTGTKYFFGRQ